MATFGGRRGAGRGVEGGGEWGGGTLFNKRNFACSDFASVLVKIAIFCLNQILSDP